MFRGVVEAGTQVALTAVESARCAYDLGINKRPFSMHCEHFFKEMQNIAQLQLDDEAKEWYLEKLKATHTELTEKYLDTIDPPLNRTYVSGGIIRYLADTERMGHVATEIRKLVARKQW
ncbi:MAG: hypothetical protein ACRDZY_03590 [Acidimicrobiales bacterium]